MGGAGCRGSSTQTAGRALSASPPALVVHRRPLVRGHWCVPPVPPPATASPAAKGSLVPDVSPVVQRGPFPHRGRGKGRLRPASDAVNLTRNFSGPPVHVTHVHSLANRFMALIYSFGTCPWLPLPSLAAPGRWDGPGWGLGGRRRIFCSSKPPLSPLPPAHEPAVPARCPGLAPAEL